MKTVRVLVRRISTPDETYAEGDLIPADRFDDDVLDWLLASARVEVAEDAPAETDAVACGVDECAYEGTERGLKMHTARVHTDESEDS